MDGGFEKIFIVRYRNRYFVFENDEQVRAFMADAMAGSTNGTTENAMMICSFTGSEQFSGNEHFGNCAFREKWIQQPNIDDLDDLHGRTKKLKLDAFEVRSSKANLSEDIPSYIA